MDFAAFLSPLPVDRFMAEHFGRAPLHIPAAGSRRGPLLDWAAVNALLALRTHWSAEHIALILNARAIAPEFYMDEHGYEGRGPRASAAKVDMFLRMGASLVGNAIEQIAPPVHEVTDMLAARFGARAGANLYASFEGVRAFASHYDTHEVFALQCEGEKLWRIYRNRAEAPIDPPPPDAQAAIDAAKGPVLAEVRMRPGDLLYIPRGFYHDALGERASLHLTFAVAPHSGRVLFDVLEGMALADPAFRAYLPDARGEGGRMLAEHVAALGDRLAALMRTPSFLGEVANRQRRLAAPGHVPTLPTRAPLTSYARTERLAAVVRWPAGAVLRVGNSEAPLGLLADEAEWAIGRPAFSTEELAARYPWRSPGEIDALVALLVRAGLVQRYQPVID